MPRYEKLTQEQRSLYNDLWCGWFEGGGNNIIPILRGVSVKDLWTALSELLSDRVILLRDQKSIKVILDLAKEKGVLEEVLDGIEKDDDLKIIQEGTKDQDVLDAIYQIRKSRVANKAIYVGSVCGAIAAFGVALSILALIGIAVAAALVTGLIAGGITYAMSKPSSE